MNRASLRGRLRRLGRPRQRPRFRGPSFNRLIPNLMTMIGLCFGLVAIRFGIEGRFPQAAAFIVVAAVIDGLERRRRETLRADRRVSHRLRAGGSRAGLVLAALAAHLATSRNLQRCFAVRRRRQGGQSYFR